MSEPDGYGPGVLVPSESADPRGSRAGSPRPQPDLGAFTVSRRSIASQGA